MKIKGIISGILIAIMILSAVSTPINSVAANAEGNINQQNLNGLDTDVNVESTNSVGQLIANQITSKQDEQDENNGCNLFSVEVNEKRATVSFETLQDCTIVVGIYDETGVTMVATGNKQVTIGETIVDVEIEISEMPQYFYLRAFMVDGDSLRSISTSYESPNYTEEMQEFFAKTTDDFDEDKVLNFDEDKKNNFAVYGDDTKVISQSEGQNQIISADDSTGVYVFQNADNSIISLETGDIISYEYDDGEFLIVKIATIQISGTTVTIISGDSSLEDVFDYVKIDAETGTEDAIFDPSTCDDDIIYDGLIDYDEPEYNVFNSSSSFMPRAIEEEAKQSVALSFTFAEKTIGSENTKAKISGKLAVKLENKISLYISLNYQYLELSLEYSGKINVSISGKATGKMQLGSVGFMPIPGVIIELSPSFVVEAEVKIEVSGTLKGSVGFSVSNNVGIKNNSSSPTFKPELKVEGKIFVGFSLEPRVKIISEKIVKVGFEAKVGAEVEAVLKVYEKESTTKIHTCQNCIDGEISAKFEASFEAQLFGSERLKFKYEALNKTWKLWDFYYSLDKKEFNFTFCPYIFYMTAITVTDSSKKPIAAANIAGDLHIAGDNGSLSSVDYVLTDENGIAAVYLSNRNYKLPVTKNGYTDNSCIFVIKDNSKSVKVTLYMGSGSGGSGEGNFDFTSVQAFSLGTSHSGAITKDGSLWMWGYNSHGQLGDGSTTNKHTPIKILDDAKSISLGKEHSAVIKSDGSLWMWGDNSYGQLGDNSTTDKYAPVKIMDDIKSVSLGSNHSAAIKSDGSLWVWGDNSYGQLGDYTTTNKYVPVKLLDSVKNISLGSAHSAAIKEDGSLWTWGYNRLGQLGNSTYSDNTTPVKILDNIKSVCLGSSHSAAIKSDGTLWVWGYNESGRLGNGSIDYYEDNSFPAKILDNVKSVSLGSNHSAAIKEDGSLWMWGGNVNGQLGYGISDTQYMNMSGNPTKLMDSIESISLGNGHSAATKTDGSLWVWGSNTKGQLGDGTTTDSSTPIKIMDNIMLPSSEQILTLSTSAIQPMKLTAKSSIKTASFIDLLPNEIYTFYVMKSKEEENPLEANNLLYMNQAVSDSDGKLSFQYVPTEEYADAEIFVKGATKTNLSTAKIETTDFTYNGSVQYINPIVSIDGNTLAEGEDYELCGEFSGIKAGEYVVTICGSGDYTGEVNKTYKIKAKSIAGLSATLYTASYIYNGSARKPEVTVKDGTKKLTDNVDYTITYSNNTNAGTGKVTITGKGNYTGILTKTFTIKKTDQTISASNKTKVFGNAAFSLGAKCIKGDGKLTYKSSDTKVVKISSSGKVSIKGTGKATVTITAAATTNYNKATKNIVIIVKPEKAKLKGFTSPKTKTVKVTWKKNTRATGYQIQLSSSSKFKSGNKPYNINSNRTVSKKITKLKKNKTYYVRVRSYKIVSGEKYYGSWSGIKKVRCK